MSEVLPDVIDVHAPPNDLEARALAAFAGLGQQTRLATLRLLVRHEPCGLSVGEIADALNCPHNTVSGHLGVLARAQLVVGRRQGRSVTYRVDLAGVRWLIDFLFADCCNGDPSACANLLSDTCTGECVQPSTSEQPRYPHGPATGSP